MMFPLSLGSTLDNPVGEFGDKFRAAREKKELSYDDVSNVTKISSRMLQAIEEEHFDQLPGGVFNKGFIRAYAKHLGLNPEDAVTDYLACLRQAQIDAHEVWDPQPPAPSRVAPPSSRRKTSCVEPLKPAVKAEPSAEPEELPGLQLPRAEHVRPGRKDFALKSRREIPWSIVAVSAVVIVLALILWTRHTRTTNAGTPPSTTVQANAAEVKPGPAENKIATDRGRKIANDKIADKIAKNGLAPEKSATTAPTALAVSTPVPAKPTGSPATANPST